MKCCVLAIISMCCVIAGCGSEKLGQLEPLNVKPQLFVDLGAKCSVPDGMALDGNGDIILAVPNYIDYGKLGSKIVKIDKDRKVTDWFVDLPLHPETNEVHPMGIEFGPDGNLYIADNQYFANKDCKSRLLRIIIENGSPVRCDIVVEGFKLANAVRWKGNDVYVSDTYFDLRDKKNQSGIYRIGLDEMNMGMVTLKPLAEDHRLIAQFTAKDMGVDETAGADGVCFDSKGNLYCGNFGDGVISCISFDGKGSPVGQEVIIDSPSIECCDGITCDTKSDKIYITNSKNNSVHVYDINKHLLQLLWVNHDCDGSDGLLDQPCEPLIRDNKLYVVNFDMTFPGLKNTENDQFNTISEFQLD